MENTGEGANTGEGENRGCGRGRGELVHQDSTWNTKGGTGVGMQQLSGFNTVLVFVLQSFLVHIKPL